MKFVKPALSSLQNESDVEQQFVFPLLVAEKPYGLQIPPQSVRTKMNVRRFTIDKGAAQKSYFPDYLIVQAGVPLAVVEAKAPGADLTEAFREARLYATEMNALFPNGFNPLKRVLAISGSEILAGYVDQTAPHLRLSYDEVDPYCEGFANLLKFTGATALDEVFVEFNKTIKPGRYWKPRRLVGGDTVQNGVVGFNSFGATVSAELAPIFNPVRREDRAYVAAHGYVPSLRRDRYVDPIDKVFRASTPALMSAAQPIKDTENPVEINSAFKNVKQLEHQVLLIVGGAGEGKTTFIDRLQEVSLSKEVREQTVWVHIDMNPAPISHDEIYNFLRREIVDGLRSAYTNLDFEDLSVLESIYSVEVNKFKKGLGKLLEDNPAEHRRELYRVLKEVDQDLHTQAMCHCRSLGTERGKLVVIVLDNCDKRLPVEQLLMFDAARWVQKEFRGLVVLPLRDDTYDLHKHKPPLDTALKDLVFRIEAPPFHHVLVTRIQLALNKFLNVGQKSFKFDLPNGFKIEYPAQDQAYYLASMVKSIFEHDHQIRRMLDGLSGRNLRDAFEIFQEFCRSGYISEDHIVNIRQREGVYTLPLNVVLSILLRKSFRFYDSDRGYLRNLTDIDVRDSHPNHFVRLAILRWLHAMFPKVGPTGLKGFFPLRDLIDELTLYGFEIAVLRREVEHLASAKCITTESSKAELVDVDDLVRLSPAGFVHLELLGNAYYWAAIAEDTWFSDDVKAKDVARRIGNPEQQFADTTVFYNALAVVSYLEGELEENCRFADATLGDGRFQELTDFSSARSGIKKMERALAVGPWVEVFEKVQVNQVVTGRIVNCVEYGLFVEVMPGVTGLLHRTKLPVGYSENLLFSLGEEIPVSILSIDPPNRRMSLAYAD